jgi:hypothetical protein
MVSRHRKLGSPMLQVVEWHNVPLFFGKRSIFCKRYADKFALSFV